ncbi:autotransporter outer membrane beta-barrel domain-containing protein [Helicobacter sp. 11S02629-2]|uniref:autotransporter outer membrane beta-barrel domain-containing protein n=1 Tax=Helicobacter sp. 11S02629-2 TaxID=1476195 RepID=UPI000BA69CEC|nr:autotransporter outer membrane beta-barrel domain-containing protein [Helicobacter sp. 11S02629-2]PAF43264.1 hypothetical protein BKH40_07110 [Helicobacter sp. 11S02629-2]
MQTKNLVYKPLVLASLIFSFSLVAEGSSSDHNFTSDDSFNVNTNLGNITTTKDNQGTLSLITKDIKFTDISRDERFKTIPRIKSIVFDGESGNKLLGDKENFDNDIRAYSISIGNSNQGTNEIKAGDMEVDDLSFKGSITANKLKVTKLTLDGGISSFKDSIDSGNPLDLILKNGASITTADIKNPAKLTTEGGDSGKINKVIVTSTSTLPSFSSASLSPFTTIESKGGFSITSTTFNFSTTENSFNIGTIETGESYLRLASLPKIDGKKDSQTADKNNLRKFMQAAGVTKDTKDTNALLLKEGFLSATSHDNLQIYYSSAPEDDGDFLSQTYTAKDITGKDKGKYKLVEEKLKSNFIFVDFYLGKKEKTASEGDKTIDLLAKYNDNGLFELITDTKPDEGSTSDKPQGDDPSTGTTDSTTPSSPPSSEGTKPSEKDKATNSSDKTKPQATPTSKSGVSGNVQRLAVSIGKFGGKHKSTTGGTSPSDRVLNQFFIIEGDKREQREGALNKLGDLLPSDLDNSLQNFALENQNTTTSIVDNIVQDSSLANSLKALSKLRFASALTTNTTDTKSDKDAIEYVEYIEEPSSEVYAQAFYQNIFQGTRTGIKGYSSNSFGLLAGYNYRVLDLIVGGNLSYANSMVGRETNFNTIAPRIYLYSLNEGFTYQASLGYALHAIGSERIQSFLGSKATSSHIANEFNASFLLGYKMSFNHHSITPAFRLTYLLLSQNPYEENGSFGLKIDSKTQHALLPSLGANYTYTINEDFKLMAGAFIFYDVLSKDPLVNASLLDGEISFLVASLGNESLGGNVNLSLSYALSEAQNLSLTYLGSFKSSLVASAISARYGFRF